MMSLATNLPTMARTAPGFGDLALVDQLLDRARRDFLARLGDHFAGCRIDDVLRRAGAANALGEELGDPAFTLAVG
jgi:hypothetical protein